jgi:hypothetical protein
LTPELRELEHRLVGKIRRGDREAWGELLAIFLPRIEVLAERFKIDEASVYDAMIIKLERAVYDYKEGTASFWGYVKPIVERALIDIKRSKAYRSGVQMSAFEESDRPEDRMALSVEIEPEIVELDFVLMMMPAHQQVCKSLLYRQACDEVQRTFREYLNIRRSQKCLSKRGLFNVLSEFGLPDPQGKPIGQTSLFVDGYPASVVDDYCLVGERILHEIAKGTAYPSIGKKIGEPPILINRYKAHWRIVLPLVDGFDEHVQELFGSPSEAVA